MKLNSLAGLSLLLIATFAISMLSSCYEPIEGCLDPLAANFQLDADDACDDCCSYPSVNIEFYPMWDSIYLDTINRLDEITPDTTFNDEIEVDTIFLDSILVDSILTENFELDTIQQWDTITFDTSFFYVTSEVNQRLRIIESQFLISNINVTDISGGFHSTQDSVILDCDPAETLYNTIDIIDFDDLTTEAQNIVLDFGYNSVQFEIGMTECLASVDTVGLTSQITTLENLTAIELAENEYVSQEFTVEFDGTDGLERVFSFINNEAFVSFSIASATDEFTILRGDDLSIDIDVNYDEWFKDILSSDTDEAIKQKLIQNSTTAFSLRN